MTSPANPLELKIMERTSANNYTMRAEVTLNHSGTGWERAFLVSPYKVPASGDFYVGMYQHVTTPIGNNSPASSVTVAYAVGDVTTSSGSFTESTGTKCPIMRVYYVG